METEIREIEGEVEGGEQRLNNAITEGDESVKIQIFSVEQSQKLPGIPKPLISIGQLLTFPQFLKAIKEIVANEKERVTSGAIVRTKLNQLRDWIDFLKIVNNDPEAQVLLRTQLGIKDDQDLLSWLKQPEEKLTTEQKCHKLILALAELTSVYKKIQTAKKIVEENLERLEPIENVIFLGESLTGVDNNLIKSATNIKKAALALEENNSAQKIFINAQQNSVELTLKQKFYDALAGVTETGIQIGGFLAGLLYSLTFTGLSFLGVSGKSVEQITEKYPYPITGAALGVIVYGILWYLNHPVAERVPPLFGLPISAGIGFVGLPIIKGAVTAIGNKFKN